MTAKRSEQPLLPNTYTIDQIDKMAKDWELGAFGMAMDARVRQIEKQQKLTFVELGYICLKVEQTEAWKEMYGGQRFKSFGQWVSDAAPSSRATAYASMGEVRKAIEDKLPLSDLNQMPRCNIKTINKLSSNLKHEPAIIEAAKKMEEREFLKHIEERHPSQHIEDKSPMRFNPDKSQRKKIDEAIDACMELYTLASREAALEEICADWMLSNKKELKAMKANA